MRYAARYLVSNDYRFVYFVVQKVACTSIKSALLPLFGNSPDDLKVRHEEGRGGVHTLFAESGFQINKTRFIEELADGGYRNHFKFAFVRNPYDRLVSCYLQKFTGKAKGLTQPEYNGARFYAGMTFAEFVEAASEIPDEEANPHFRSQFVTVCASPMDGTSGGDSGEGTRIMADFVGRFENLEADFESIVSEIKNGEEAGVDLELPNLLASITREGRYYSEFYTDRLKRLTAKRYEKDLEIFDYAF